MISTSHFILYVTDQARSAQFYAAVLGVPPRLDVPGMTEFDLGPGCVLGLMPLTGVTRLFNRPQPKAAEGDLRTEVYLLVADPQELHARAIQAGACELSPYSLRDWGHYAAYSVDFDGNVLAFARLA
jgi:uncharacterized protein